MLEKRVSLAHLPTPVIALDRLGASLGMRQGSLLAKLDDVIGPAAGGNKLRKLEYLCADALARGCDTLVTGGGGQSNHARLTAAAARRLGLECTLVLGGPAPEQAVGNQILDRVLGAEIVFIDAYSFEAVEARIAEISADLARRGRRPYTIPIGGSTALGALGYVRCADEIRAQVSDVDLVVAASGSGGTHAGLVAGLGSHDAVHGVDVGARPGIASWIDALALETAALAGRPAPRGSAHVDASQIGDGYGAHTDACREAILMTARLEGIVLDPVYTGKTMASLIAARRGGAIAAAARVVFVHTGGLPALFTPGHAAWVTTP